MKTRITPTLKVILLITGLLILLGGVSSCTMENDVEEATITLSIADGVVRFSKEASEQVVTVNATSSTPWGLISNGEWMEAIKDGNNLIIKVAKNPLPEARQATILVTAGKATAQITIQQESGDLSIALLPTSLNVDQLGGNFVVDVVSNTNDWQATTSAEWIEVASLPYSKQIKLTVKPTKERKERIATIYFSNAKESNSDTELTVRQDPVMWFDLPYLDFEHGSISHIREFEMKRHSTQMTTGGVGFENFATLSTQFPNTAYYSFTPDGNAFVASRMYAKDESVLKGEQLQEFIEYLKGMGFSSQNLPKDLAKDAILYHPVKKISVHLRLGVTLPIYGDPHIAFIYRPDQPEAYPTFPTIDDAIGFKNFAGGHIAVAAYETTKGGILKDGEINDQNKTPKNQKYERKMPDGSGIMEIIYWYEWAEDGTSKVTKHRQVFTHSKYMFWTYKGLFGYVTDEFRQLSREAGYMELPFILFQNRGARAFLNPTTGWSLIGAHWYNWRKKRTELWLDSAPIGSGAKSTYLIDRDTNN